MQTTVSDPERWLDEHGDYLYAYAMKRLRNRSHAEDAVQETLLAALSSRASFTGTSTERTWLCGIMRHKIADQFRRMVREAPRQERAEDLGFDDFFDADGHHRTAIRAWEDPGAALENKEFLAQFEECLRRVPPRQARVFALRALEDCGSEDICKALNISATNYWVLFHRARLVLRECLERRWFHRGAGEHNVLS